MGQKVNPIGIRTGHFLPWKSRWFANGRDFQNFLLEDVKIRKGLTAKLKLAGITTVEIERLTKSMIVTITVSRPGVVIGRGGTGIDSSAANAPIPYYGYENGQNTRFIPIIKENSLWKIDGIATGP